MTDIFSRTRVATLTEHIFVLPKSVVLVGDDVVVNECRQSLDEVVREGERPSTAHITKVCLKSL